MAKPLKSSRSRDSPAILASFRGAVRQGVKIGRLRDERLVTELDAATQRIASETRLMRQIFYIHTRLVVWLISGDTLVSINEVTLRRARLVLGWVTGPEFNSRCRKPISVYNQSPRSTQPGYLSVGRRNEYQPKGGDALRLGSKDRYGSCHIVCGWQVKLCDLLATTGYIWAL